MSELFSLEDIFNIMIELETLGNKHYLKMKEMTEDIKLKYLFGSLAKAELAHKKLYQDLKVEIISFKHEKVDQEYREYIQALLSQTVKFLDASCSACDFETGFNIALQLEKDTILFLNELRALVEPSYYETIDRVIKEEQSHLKALYDFENKIK